MNIHYPKPNGRKYKGLGDFVAAGTKATGIDKVVKFAANAVGIDDCGCSKRQELLNESFPFKSKK
jgi:hypothetical protein